MGKGKRERVFGGKGSWGRVFGGKGSWGREINQPTKRKRGRVFGGKGSRGRERGQPNKTDPMRLAARHARERRLVRGRRHRQARVWRRQRAGRKEEKSLGGKWAMLGEMAAKECGGMVLLAACFLPVEMLLLCIICRVANKCMGLGWVGSTGRPAAAYGPTKKHVIVDPRKDRERR